MGSVICDECSTPFEREIPEGLQGIYRKIAEGLRVCPGCVERIEDDERREEDERAERERAERVRRRRLASGVPESFCGKTWSDAPDAPPEAITAAQRWAGGDLLGVFLTGGVGVGKTTIAAAAAWKMLERAPVRWVDAAELLSRLSRDFGDPLRREALDALSTAEGAALVLDDIDKARPTEAAAVELYRAIDNRVKAGSPLLVTSNLTLAELRDRYPHGQAIVSRLVLHCQALLLRGPDRRLTAAHMRAVS